jgi:TPR repeat protein
MDHMEMTPIMQWLAERAAQYKASQAARNLDLACLQLAMLAADGEGVNKRADVLRVADVARQTFYDTVNLSEEELAELYRILDALDMEDDLKTAVYAALRMPTPDEEDDPAEVR